MQCSERSGQNFKIAIINMFRDLKEDVNILLNGVCENTVECNNKTII